MTSRYGVMYSMVHVVTRALNCTIYSVVYLHMERLNSELKALILNLIIIIIIQSLQ